MNRIKRHFFVYVCIAAILLAFVRIRLSDRVAAPPAEAQRPRQDTYEGFAYRAPWNSDGTVLFLRGRTGMLLRIGRLPDALQRTLETGCYIRLRNVAPELPQTARNPGVFDYRRYLRTRGVSYLCTPKEENITVLPETPLAYRLRGLGARVRSYALAAQQRWLGAEAGALVHAVMTGDTGKISDDSKETFENSGVSHLMAVSGMHVTFILMPFQALGRTSRRLDIRGRSILLWIPLLLFWILADGSPSVTRACFTAAGTALAKTVGRPPDTLNLLALSAALQILYEPYVLYSASFLLSYGAVLSILLLLPGVQRRLSWLRSEDVGSAGSVRKLQLVNRQSLAVGVAVNIGLLPLMLTLFGSVSVSGILITLYAAPLALLLCAGGYVLCLCTALPFSTVLCKPLAAILYAVYRLLLQIVRAERFLPSWLSRYTYYGFPAAAAVVYYILVWLLFSQSARRLLRRAGRAWRHMRIGSRRRCAIAAALAIGLLTGVGVYARTDTALIRILFVDVGQGSAVLVRADGYTGLIDTGDGRTDMTEVLHAAGVEKLDFLVLTHGHADHTGGVAEILPAFRPDTVYMSGNGEEGLQAVREAARQAACRVHTAENGSWVQLGDVRMDFLVCSSFFGQEEESAENNASLNVRLSCAYGSVMVCGDLETEAEEALCAGGMLSDCDVLFAPHHGSKNGTGENLLSNLTPEYVIISAGIGNRYGHPAPETLRRLAAAQTDVYRTDLQGGISLQIGRRTLFRKDCIAIWQTLHAES